METKSSSYNVTIQNALNDFKFNPNYGIWLEENIHINVYPPKYKKKEVKFFYKLIGIK